MAAAAEVAQGENVKGGLGHRRGGGDGLLRRATPIAPRPLAHRQQRIAEGATGECDDQPIGHNPEEGAHAALRGVERGRVRQRHGQQQRQHRRQHGDRRHQRAIALEQTAHAGGPGVFGVGFGAQRGECLGDIDPKGMRRRVLAGVVAALAAMTEIGEVGEIRPGEFTAHRHGGEDGAIAFAIAAGIADFHLPPGLHHRISFGQVSRPPRLQCGQRRCRWSCQIRRDSPGPRYCRP